MKGITDPDRARAIVERLREFRGELGFVPGWYFDQACAELNRSRASLQRWIKDGVPPRERPRFELGRELKVVVFDEHGVGAAWDALRREGTDVPSRATWYRAAARDLTEFELRYAKGGLRAARRAQLRLERLEGRRCDCLIADHKLADLIVSLPGRAKPVRPWITSFQEPSTRAIAGLAVSVRPHRGVVLAALGEAMRAHPELTPVYGKPWIIRFDNGLEFLAKAVRSAAIDLGFTPVPLRAWSPWLNGKIERRHQTMTYELIRRLPHWTDGPKRPNGSLAIPDDVAPLPIEVFIELLLAWVSEYNFVRPHSSLGGRTPAQAWRDDATPVREVSEADLRRYLLEGFGTRVVESRGVKVKDGWYTSPVLQDHQGERVEPRGRPHDDRSVELFVDGEWLCSAVAHGQATPAVRQAALEARASAARRAAGIKRGADRRARVRYSTMTSAQPPEVTNVVSQEETETLDADRYTKLLDALGLAARRGQRRR